MNITWLSQGGYVFESEGFRLVVDPYISDFVEKKQGVTRLVPPPLGIEELKPDVLFATHDHIDHLDPEAAPEIAAMYPDCIVAGSTKVCATAVGLGIPKSRTYPVDYGGEWRIGPFMLIPTLAHHGDSGAVGIILKADGTTVYLSGDSEYSEELVRDVSGKAAGSIDLVLICINGRLGNMNRDQALEAVMTLKPSAAIPMHYDLFKENTEDPEPFVTGCIEMGVKSELLNHGEARDILSIVRG